MTDELDKLRPDVREAVDAFDIGARIGMTFGNKGWNIIRAELLRLAKENTSRPANTNEAIDLMATWINRAQNAEAELATAQNTIDAQQDTMGALKRKLMLSEGELAALKARIADSPIASLVYGQGDLLVVISAENPDDWAGKRVRLVVEE